MGQWRSWSVWGALRSPTALVAWVPATALMAYGVFGVWGLVTVSLATPTLLWCWQCDPAPDAGTGIADMASLSHKAEGCLRGTWLHGGSVCAMILHLQSTDTDDPLTSALGAGVAKTLRSILRDTDQVWSLPDGRLCVLVAARHGLSPATAQALARRVQTAAEMPMGHNADPVRVRCALGLASAPYPGRTLGGGDLVDAAAQAANHAMNLGPSGLVSADPPPPPKPVDMSLVIEARRALDTDQIVPWYQPQVCARTGRLTGVEALARWDHPQRGIITPAGFLPALDQAGVGTRLGEVMLHHACAALQTCQAAGLHIPTVALNLSQAELAMPGLAQRIAWDLEAHDMDPARLRIEILETVAVSGSDGVPGQNIANLRLMG
ncbi:MAG: EAL domain-containing protein, partial [Paracoccaceae bacterium]